MVGTLRGRAGGGPSEFAAGHATDVHAFGGRHGWLRGGGHSGGRWPHGRKLPHRASACKRADLLSMAPLLLSPPPNTRACEWLGALLLLMGAGPGPPHNTAPAHQLSRHPLRAQGPASGAAPAQSTMRPHAPRCAHSLKGVLVVVRSRELQVAAATPTGQGATNQRRGRGAPLSLLLLMLWRLLLRLPRRRHTSSQRPARETPSPATPGEPQRRRLLSPTGCRECACHAPTVPQ